MGWGGWLWLSLCIAAQLEGGGQMCDECILFQMCCVKLCLSGLCTVPLPACRDGAACSGWWFLPLLQLL